MASVFNILNSAVFQIILKYYYCFQMEGNARSGTCNMHGKEKQNLFEDLDVDARIALKISLPDVMPFFD